MRRRQRAQSMVEYAIGIGAVTAVCMLVLGGLGASASDVVLAVLKNINSPSSQSQDASVGNSIGIYSNGVAGTSNAPWQVK